VALVFLWVGYALCFFGGRVARTLTVKTKLGGRVAQAFTVRMKLGAPRVGVTRGGFDFDFLSVLSALALPKDFQSTGSIRTNPVSPFA
jgi:hypothetical protein